MSSVKTMGQTAFDSYNHEREGLTYDGKPVPAWQALPVPIRSAWECAALAVAERIVAELPPKTPRPQRRPPATHSCLDCGAYASATECLACHSKAVEPIASPERLAVATAARDEETYPCAQCGRTGGAAGALCLAAGCSGVCKAWSRPQVKPVIYPCTLCGRYGEAAGPCRASRVRGAVAWEAMCGPDECPGTCVATFDPPL